MRKVCCRDGSSIRIRLHANRRIRQRARPVEIHLANVEPEPVAWQTRGMEDQAIDAHLTASPSVDEVGAGYTQAAGYPITPCQTRRRGASLARWRQAGLRHHRHRHARLGAVSGLALVP